MKRPLIAVASGLLLVLFGCSEDLPTGTADSGQATDDSQSVLAPAYTDAAHGVHSRVTTYEVTIENLTPATGNGSSQPFSPPILATHNHSIRVFRKGAYASPELAQVAEDAVNGPLMAALEGSHRVLDVVSGAAAILPGESATFEIEAGPGRRQLSAVFMLVNTNDGFSGVDGVNLPVRGERSWEVYAYDAGSEENTEMASDIPGPCCNSPLMGPDEHKRIRRHPGIAGTGDLDPDIYGWSDPVARITVRRVPATYSVTIENLTPATVSGGSQVFSPPILATHGSRTMMWRPWSYASDELIRIAEEGDTGPMKTFLEGASGVQDVVASMNPIPPGGSDTFEVTADGYGTRLSSAFMLVNTNDGFAGTWGVHLPVGGSATWFLGAYDAGSEVNTELASDIPGPCCNSHDVGPDEHKRIRHHAGIQGTGDLSAADYGWTDPVAKLTIERIR